MKPQKPSALLVILSVLLAPAIGCAALPTTGERVLEQHVRVHVAHDGALSVTQTIRVRSTGERMRYGLAMVLADEMPDSAGNVHPVTYTVEGATRDGEAIAYTTESAEGGTLLLLGDRREALVPGEHVYEIRYRTGPHVFTVGGYRELPFNPSSPGGVFPIDSASATFLLPDAMPRQQLEVYAYTGPAHALQRDARVRVEPGPRVSVSTRRSLGLNEGLIVVIRWPAVPPGISQ